MLFFLIIVVFLLSVITHEMTHYLVFRFQGIKVISLKVFLIVFTKDKTFLETNLNPVAYVIPSTQNVDNVMKLSVFLKTMRDNFLITSLVQFLQIIFSLLALIMFKPSSTIIYIIVIFIIVNTLMLLGSIDNYRGDLNLVRSYHKKKLKGFYAIICTSQFLEGFRNEFVYSFMKEKWMFSKNSHEFDLIMLNYIVEYEFSVLATVTDELISYLSNQIKTNNYKFLYLYYKTFLYYFVVNGRLYHQHDIFDYTLHEQKNEISSSLKIIIGLVKQRKKINVNDIVLYRNISESTSDFKNRKENLANTMNNIIGGLSNEKEN